MSNSTATAAAATASTAAVILTNDDATAAALVASIKSSVNSAPKYAAYVEAHGVNRSNLKDHARALAVLSYPNDEPVQTTKTDDGTKVRTRFGNAVQAAGAGLRKHVEAPARKDRDLLAELVKAADRAREAGIDDDTIAAALALVPAAALAA